VWLGVAAAMVVAVFPFLWLLTTSLKSPADVSRTPPAWIFEPTLENFQHILTAPEVAFEPAFVTTIVVTVVATILSVAIGTMAAYGLARLRTPGRGAYSGFVLWTRLLPPIVLVIPLYLLLLRTGLRDTWLGLIVVYTAFNVPFVIWIMQSFLTDFPVEIEEASLIDGCSRLRSLVLVVLPLCGPGLATAAALTAFWVWNDFLFAFIFAGNNVSMIMLVAARFQEEEGVRWGFLAAASMLAILPVLVFAFVVQRYIVGGLVSGSIKG
jgi:multiple sugar transport system permease protein